MIVKTRIQHALASGFSVCLLLLIQSCSNPRTSPLIQLPEGGAKEVYAAYFSNSVEVLDPTSSGTVTALRKFGDLTGLNAPRSVTVDTVNDEIYVLNADSITVYPRSSKGNVAPLRKIAGPFTRLDQPVTLAVDSINNEIFVMNYGSASVLVFQRTANGDISPGRTLIARVGTVNPLGSLAVDVQNNEIYVGLLDGSIVVYERGAIDNAVPKRVLAGNNTNLNSHDPLCLAVDTKNDELLVLAWDYSGTAPNPSSIFVYSRTASGDVAPIRTVSIPATIASFNELRSMEVDSINNEVLIGNINSNSILIIARTASGTFTPLRTIVGPTTALRSPFIALDSANGEIIAVNSNPAGYITAYPRIANGETEPLRTISGSFSGLVSIKSIAVDMVNNEIFVANEDSINIYISSADGNVTPIRSIVGPATTLSNIQGIAVDSVNDELFIVQTGSVAVFLRTATGNASPIRALAGPSTGLSLSTGIVVDTQNDEVFLANGNSVNCYSRTADGDVAPLRAIAGTSTHLGYLTGIALDIKNNELIVSNISDYRHRVPSEDSVLAFERTANGDAVPHRRVNGVSTGLYYPRGVAVDVKNNEIYIGNAGTSTPGIAVFPRTADGDNAPTRSIVTPAPVSFALTFQRE